VDWVWFIVAEVVVMLGWWFMGVELGWWRLIFPAASWIFRYAISLGVRTVCGSGGKD
jgi:hypothetical protein